MKALMLVVALGLSAGLAAGQQDSGLAGSSASWLKLGGGARSAAMGGAGSVLIEDADVAGMNPAGLARLKGGQAAFMHHALVLDASMEHLALGWSAMDGLGVALNADYLNFGSVDTYTLNGSTQTWVKTGSFTPSGLQGSLGLGYKLGVVAVGASGKWVSQNLDGANDSTFAGDAGFVWMPAEQGLSLGFAALNLGGQLAGAPLPSSLRLGSGWRQPLASGHRLGLALDADLPTAELASLGLSLGGEALMAEQFAFRAGYKWLGQGGAAGFSLGLGAQVSMLGLDYAFTAGGPFGGTHQVGAKLRF